MAPAPRMFGIIMKALLAIVLTGLVVRYSLTQYLAETDPELALHFDSGNPTALRELAANLVDRIEASDAPQAGAPDPDEQTLARLRFTTVRPGPAANAAPEGRPFASPPPDRAETLTRARHLAEKALAADPLDDTSATLLARIVELQSPPETAAATAEPYYAAAARLSNRATGALYWLLRRNIAKANYDEAVRLADILMRSSSNARPAVVPALARLAEIPAALPGVKALVTADPPWRRMFFANMTASITDARTPLVLFLALKDTKHPPEDDELQGYLTFLVAKGFDDLAYYTWLQFLPPERLASAGLLFNGRFEHDPTRSPFDWQVHAGPGTKVEFLPRPDIPGGRGLRIEFSIGRVALKVSQTLVLHPGRYRFTGSRMGALEGLRGLRWRISCAGRSHSVAAETPMHKDRVTSWQPFSLDFEIPPASCAFQHISLELDARSSSEQLVKGTMWYRDLAIRNHQAGDGTSN